MPRVTQPPVGDTATSHPDGCLPSWSNFSPGHRFAQRGPTEQGRTGRARGLSTWPVQIRPQGNAPHQLNLPPLSLSFYRTILPTQVPPQHTREGGTCGLGTSPEASHGPGGGEWPRCGRDVGRRAEVTHSTAPLSWHLKESERDLYWNTTWQRADSVQSSSQQTFCKEPGGKHFRRCNRAGSVAKAHVGRQQGGSHRRPVANGGGPLPRVLRLKRQPLRLWFADPS